MLYILQDIYYVFDQIDSFTKEIQTLNTLENITRIPRYEGRKKFHDKGRQDIVTILCIVQYINM